MTDLLAYFLSKHDDIDVVAQASDSTAAWALLSDRTADVAVLDGMLLPASRERVARSNLVSMGVVVMTMNCGKSPEITTPLEQTVPTLAQVGMCQTADSIVEAIRFVARGGSRVGDGANRKRATRPCPFHSAPRPFGLTVSELRVLKLLVEGNSNGAISETLEVRLRTVESHRYRLMKKLEVRNAAELAVVAVRAGLVDV
ncbi:MAG TPA: response regulator transcription factor [Vicinamibacteria bacterium]|nr:response regulator transcription factor [Vicinamibacteria bacterium]